MRALIADDHETVREGIARLLERDARVVVVGEANCGAAAIEGTRLRRPDAGADRYVSKGGPSAELLAAILHAPTNA